MESDGETPPYSVSRKSSRISFFAPPRGVRRSFITTAFWFFACAAARLRFFGIGEGFFFATRAPYTRRTLTPASANNVSEFPKCSL